MANEKLIGMILKYKSYEERLIKSNFILTLKIIYLWTYNLSNLKLRFPKSKHLALKVDG